MLNIRCKNNQPKVVSYMILLLIISVCLYIVELSMNILEIINIATKEEIIFITTSCVVIASTAFLLIVLLYIGNNIARIIYILISTIFMPLGFLYYLYTFEGLYNLASILYLTALTLQIITFILIFNPATRKWYKAHNTGIYSKETEIIEKIN